MIFAGTSSFGMSGVNAHALFSPAPEKDQGARPVLLGIASYLQRKLVWPVPHPHHLLQLCTASSPQQAAFSFNIVAMMLAYLADHKVRPTATISWKWPIGAMYSNSCNLLQLVSAFKGSHKQFHHSWTGVDLNQHSERSHCMASKLLKIKAVC